MRATRRLAGYLGPYKHWVILAPLLMALEVAMDLMQPRLVQRIIDEGVARRDLGVVLESGLWMVGLSLVGLAGGIGCGVFAIMAAQGFGADLRGGLFGRVQALSFSNLDRLETGGLITRLTNDVTQVQDVVHMLLRIMVRVPLLLVGSLIMAVLTSSPCSSSCSSPSWCSRSRGSSTRRSRSSGGCSRSSTRSTA